MVNNAKEIKYLRIYSVLLILFSQNDASNPAAIAVLPVFGTIQNLAFTLLIFITVQISDHYYTI